MGYHDSIAALCIMGSITNPLQEEDIKISRIHFFRNGEKIASIVGNDKNRGSRLFFQSKFSSSLFQVGEASLQSQFREVAAEFFAEYWDAEAGLHPTIDALKQADTVKIFWKA